MKKIQLRVLLISFLTVLVPAQSFSAQQPENANVTSFADFTNLYSKTADFFEKTSLNDEEIKTFLFAISVVRLRQSKSKNQKKLEERFKKIYTTINKTPTKLYEMMNSYQGSLKKEIWDFSIEDLKTQLQQLLLMRLADIEITGQNKDTLRTELCQAFELQEETDDNQKNFGHIITNGYQTTDIQRNPKVETIYQKLCTCFDQAEDANQKLITWNTLCNSVADLTKNENINLQDNTYDIHLFLLWLQNVQRTDEKAKQQIKNFFLHTSVSIEDLVKSAKDFNKQFLFTPTTRTFDPAKVQKNLTEALSEMDETTQEQYQKNTVAQNNETPNTSNTTTFFSAKNLLIGGGILVGGYLLYSYFKKTAAPKKITSVLPNNPAQQTNLVRGQKAVI